MKKGRNMQSLKRYTT